MERTGSGLAAMIARVLAIAAVLATSVPAAAQADQQDLIDSAQTTIANFVRDPDMDWLRRNLGEAKAVLIAPQIVKVGWILGGSGGRAVLLVRNVPSGRWEGPAFYTIAAATVGFQAGIAVTENVTLVMTDKGLRSLMSASLNLGGDASVAAGPIGAGAAADITSDFLTFTRAKGVYGGLNLEGSVIAVATDWNTAYYGRPVAVSDIVITGTVRNAEAARLAQEVARAAGQKKSAASQ